MIFDMVIYVTLIHLKEMECILLLLLKELSISLFMCSRIFNFGQSKMIFCGDENLKKLYYKCKCL